MRLTAEDLHQGGQTLRRRRLVSECHHQIPAQRMKANRMHGVPLNERVMAILDEMAKLQEGSGLVFPGLNDGVPLSDMTLRRFCVAGGAAIWRRMASVPRSTTGQQKPRTRRARSLKAALVPASATRPRRRINASICSKNAAH